MRIRIQGAKSPWIRIRNRLCRYTKSWCFMLTGGSYLYFFNLFLSVASIRNRQKDLRKTYLGWKYIKKHHWKVGVRSSFILFWGFYRSRIRIHNSRRPKSLQIHANPDPKHWYFCWYFHNLCVIIPTWKWGILAAGRLSWWFSALGARSQWLVGRLCGWSPHCTMVFIKKCVSWLSV